MNLVECQHAVSHYQSPPPPNINLEKRIHPDRWTISLLKKSGKLAFIASDLQKLLRCALTNSTRRAKAHRERKTSNNLKRWEFYVPELLQTKVHAFAKAQGLSVGAAAKVLLNLGFQSFNATSSASGSGELDGVKPAPILSTISYLDGVLD